MTSRFDRFRAGALYLGGLLGPFGGGIVQPMQPELRATLDASKQAVASSLTLYFIPFAVLLLVSGTLGERWGRRRTVQRAYLLYAGATLVCAVAPGIHLFLAGRALQGAANAFTTPLVLAGLSDMASPGALGRAIGIFASCQAAGQSIGPVLGGLAAEVNWRWAFIGVALVSLALMVVPPPGEPRRGLGNAPPWRPLFSARMGLLCVTSFCLGSGLVGIGFLVAERARDGLGLSAGEAGFVLLGYGLAGLALGQVWGRLTDRRAATGTGMAAMAVGVVLVGSVGHLRTVALLASCWVLAGACASLANVSAQRLTVDTVPDNRGGAVSTMSAFRFLGSALAPVLWLPLYDRGAAVAFQSAGATLVIGVLALLGIRQLGRRTVADSTAAATTA